MVKLISAILGCAAAAFIAFCVWVFLEIIKID